jgi:hypothetical protein
LQQGTRILHQHPGAIVAGHAGKIDWDSAVENVDIRTADSGSPYGDQGVVWRTGGWLSILY